MEFHGIHRSPIEYGRIQLQCDKLELHDSADFGDSAGSPDSGSPAADAAPVEYIGVQWKTAEFNSSVIHWSSMGRQIRLCGVKRPA